MSERMSFENHPGYVEALQQRAPPESSSDINRDSIQTIYVSGLPNDPESNQQEPSPAQPQPYSKPMSELEKQELLHFDQICRRDLEILHLQQVKINLETMLGELRAKSIQNKVVGKQTTQAKSYETWQIAGVLIIAIFLGYFLGTK